MKLSVIVPVYNVEHYLVNCVESILQNNVDKEVILVDDGSTDGSSILCDNFAEVNDCIKVIHKENGGLSSARNAGMNVAVGDFITFVDSDDYISDTIYEECLKIIEENNLDGIKFKNKCVFDQKYCFKEQQIFELKVMGNSELLDYLFRVKDSYVSYSMCNIIIKKDIVNELRFIDKITSEDVVMSFEILRRCNKFAFINTIGYAYYQREVSITNAGFSEKRADMFKVWEIVKGLNTDPARDQIIDLNIIYYKFVYLSLLLRDKKHVAKEVYLQYKNLLLPQIKDNKNNLRNFKGMDFKRKFMLTLMCFNFELSGMFIRLYYKGL